MRFASGAHKGALAVGLKGFAICPDEELVYKPKVVPRIAIVGDGG
jgi:hypothetical protein